MGLQRERGQQFCRLVQICRDVQSRNSVDTDTLLSQNIGGTRKPGLATTHWDFQYRFVRQKKFVPAMAISYFTNVPERQREQGPRTGKYDHQNSFSCEQGHSGRSFSISIQRIFFLGRSVLCGTDQNSQRISRSLIRSTKSCSSPESSTGHRFNSAR